MCYRNLNKFWAIGKDFLYADDPNLLFFTWSANARHILSTKIIDLGNLQSNDHKADDNVDDNASKLCCFYILYAVSAINEIF